MITFAQNEYWHCAQVPFLQTSPGGHQIFAKGRSLADLYISRSEMNTDEIHLLPETVVGGKTSYQDAGLLSETELSRLETVLQVWLSYLDHLPHYLEL